MILHVKIEMFQKLMEFVQRRQKEVQFFYDQLDKWFEVEPDLSLNERASILCNVIDCFEGEDIVKLDSMYQFIVCESWKDSVPYKSSEYNRYIESFDMLLDNLQKAKNDNIELNNVIQLHKQKCVALLRLLDYHSIRRLLDECIADGLSEEHFTLLNV